MHGKDDASDHLDQLKVWFGDQWPHANVGLVTGAVSGVVVLDVDPRNGGDIEIQRLWNEHGAFPMGPVAATGGGGWHYYFKHPGTPIRSRNGAVGEGLDVKADGGYVIAPPSVHRTGMSYEWCEGLSPAEVSTPDLPTWLLLLMAQDNGSPFESVREIPQTIREGQRRTQLLSLAGSMRHRNMGEKAIFAALMAENEEKCTPPLETAEVTRIASSAKDWAPGEATLLSTEKLPQAAKVRRVLLPYTAADLEFKELPDPQWAITGILPEGLCLFAGPIKLGKSYLILGVALAIAEGDVVLDLDSTQEGDVLYIALEDSERRMKTRIGQIHADPKWPPRLEIIDLSHEMPRMDEGGLDFIDAWLGQHSAARLVVIDTLQRFRSRTVTKKGVYAADVDEIEPLQQLALRHGVAIVCIHHYNKALHDDWVDSISGSSGVGGTADTLWGIDRPRGKSGQKEGRLRITGRDVEEQDLTMEMADYRWKIIGDRDEQELSSGSPALQEVVSYMQRRPWETYGIAEVQAALGKATYDAARTLLNRCLAAGLIRKRGRGLFGLPEQAFGETGVGGTDTVVRFGSVESEPNNGEPAAKPFEPNTEESLFSGSDVPKPQHQKKETYPNISRIGQPRPRSAPELPTQPCPNCGEQRWSLRVGGRPMCDACHPAVRPVEEEQDDSGRGAP